MLEGAFAVFFIIALFIFAFTMWEIFIYVIFWIVTLPFRLFLRMWQAIFGGR
ncbi:hypothetical protein OZX65_03030 [Leuconostocaceae bacterium ESL0723]|nr:hypothetical protein [Lactobacillaceae bacterium L1_55_11]WEV55049.1 hypothetical protein OZX65_03030 [Leuconostocaceae bacterium ESL0723]